MARQIPRNSGLPCFASPASLEPLPLGTRRALGMKSEASFPAFSPCPGALLLFFILGLRWIVRLGSLLGPLHRRASLRPTSLGLSFRLRLKLRVRRRLSPFAAL